MKLIDTNTGETITQGQTWRNVNGSRLCILIRPGLFSARVDYANLDDGSLHRITVPIRLTHPAFFLQRVAFFPS